MLRELTASLDAWTANGIRYPLAAILYWPVLWLAYRRGRLDTQLLISALLPALLALAGQILWALAPYYLPASVIGFFVRMSLVWSLIAAMLLFADERSLLSRPAFYFGLLLSTGGFVTMAVSKGTLDAQVTWTGIVIISFCSMFFGLYAVSVRHVLRGTNPLLGFGVVSQLVSAGTLIAMFCFGDHEPLARMSGTSWTILIASSILGIALGHFFLYTGVQRLGAAITSGVGSVSPFITALLAAAFLNESLRPVEWAGGVTMVIGAMILLSTQRTVKVR